MTGFLKRYDILAESKESPEELASRLVPKDPILRKVAEDVLFMRYKKVNDDVTAALRVSVPKRSSKRLKGMDVVGELYGRGIYYLPHVMVHDRCHGRRMLSCARAR